MKTEENHDIFDSVDRSIGFGSTTDGIYRTNIRFVRSTCQLESCVVGKAKKSHTSIAKEKQGEICFLSFFSKRRVLFLKNSLHDMLAWGVNAHGQLGLGPSALASFIPTPQRIAFFNDRLCTQVACSLTHSVFLLNDGTVYTAGNNEYSQLGREGRTTVPGRQIAD